MSSKSSFLIYSASAGSGKTYTLVKSYLTILLGANSPEIFKRILALTFTNKAVAEMKERIIETLTAFSNEAILNTSENTLFNSLCEELNISPQSLHYKSKSVLESIIHNYAAFDISTIDGFTHRIIRTFAYDLKLPINFEVELDQDSLINEAVDRLINRAGTDKKLTEILVDFAIEKADDDKSWDITLDLNKIAKTLVNENDIPFLKTFKDKTLEDFQQLKTHLFKEVATVEAVMVSASQQILDIFESCGVAFEDFSGAYLPKHFKKLSEGNFNLNFGPKWQEDLENKTLYPKRVSPETAANIDQIQPQIAQTFNETKRAFFHRKFLKAFSKNITPLSVLNAINKELTVLKEEQNKLLISEFNSIISNQIKDQPTPFIYERIGEKFKHYFIDEFQDTSVKQWENLIPLLNNAVSVEYGSVMLVGDAKQAIYRWRGGKAEQFINLYNKKSNPFNVAQQIGELNTNYRSSKSIVNFNNSLFKFIADEVFQHPDYIELYTNSGQIVHNETEGFVSLSFLDISKDDDRDFAFATEVLHSIEKCIAQGYNYADITVLVRKKKEGVAIANFLSENEIPIISSETLLLVNSPKVNFLNNFLRLLLYPENNEIKIEVLNYLSELLSIQDKHEFFSNTINLELFDLLKWLKNYDIKVSFNLLQLPLFDLVETLVRDFNLTSTSNAYIQYYLDIVLDFYNKNGTDIAEFLKYFEAKKDTLSIISPEGQNAVQIMTIHKSKGLEFQVVIFPYADLDIYQEIEPKEWFALDTQQNKGFSHALLNFNNDFEHFGEQGLNIHNTHRSEQRLDNINLLYVVLTRPKEQLFIISKYEDKTIENKKYSDILINYLKHRNEWKDNTMKYLFGSEKKISLGHNATNNVQFQNSFISTPKEALNIKIVTKAGTLWDTHQKKAIEKGNLIHDILSKIYTEDDVENTLKTYLEKGMLNPTQLADIKKTIFKIIAHPKLADYFNSNFTIINEQDIYSKTGETIRPDKLVLNQINKTATILDYKTGAENKKHQIQLNTYGTLIEDLGYTIIAKILVYINDEISVKMT
ncbi:MAG: UvrD-helicase domain-containing protein [Jejuia sp.]